MNEITPNRLSDSFGQIRIYYKTETYSTIQFTLKKITIPTIPIKSTSSTLN